MIQSVWILVSQQGTCPAVFGVNSAPFRKNTTIPWYTHTDTSPLALCAKLLGSNRTISSSASCCSRLAEGNWSPCCCSDVMPGRFPVTAPLPFPLPLWVGSCWAKLYLLRVLLQVKHYNMQGHKRKMSIEVEDISHVWIDTWTLFFFQWDMNLISDVIKNQRTKSCCGFPFQLICLSVN